jgi:hypothetical protein
MATLPENELLEAPAGLLQQLGCHAEIALRSADVYVVRISAIVDACFRLIVDGVSAPSWTRRDPRKRGINVAQTSVLTAVA